MLVTFFDIRRIVHYEFVPTEQTVNQVYYLEVLERKLDENDPYFLPTTHGSSITTTHLLARQSVREFLATKQINVLEHPVYSPDPAPSDFFLFPKVKEILK